MIECIHCPKHCPSIYAILKERYDRYGKKLGRIWVSVAELKIMNETMRRSAGPFTFHSIEEELKHEEDVLLGKIRIVYKGIKLIIKHHGPNKITRRA